MPTSVPSVRRPSRLRRVRVPATRSRAQSPAPGGVATEPTFAEIATQYLERHIQRYLVPRAAQLARYAHAYLATVKVPRPGGGSMPLTAKPFRQRSTTATIMLVEGLS